MVRKCNRSAHWCRVQARRGVGGEYSRGGHSEVGREGWRHMGWDDGDGDQGWLAHHSVTTV